MNKIVEALLLVLLVATCSFANWTGETSEPEKAIVDGVSYYQISTPEELAWFAAEVNIGSSDINAQLKNDIVLWNGEFSGDFDAPRWISIGVSSEEPFKGVFDGQNYTVTGLYVNDTLSLNSKDDNCGMFGYIHSQGVVKNLNVENGFVNVYVDGTFDELNPFAGGIAAWNEGEILNVSFSGIVKVNAIDGDVEIKAHVGGIVGHNEGSIVGGQVNGQVVHADEGSFSNCTGGISGYNNKLIKNSVNKSFVLGEFVGGVVGCAEVSTVLDSCVNEGTVKLLDTKADFQSKYVAGIAGLLAGSASARKCVNNGNVLFDGRSLFAGGLFGYVTNNVKIDSCENNGEVKGKSSDYSQAGGIAGQLNSATLNFVQNKGDVYVDGYASTYVGGIAGYASGDVFIKDADNTGSISSFAKMQNEYSGGTAYAGGITGYLYYNSEIIESHNEGAVYAEADALRGSTYSGGISGGASYGKRIAGCVNEGDVSALGSHNYLGGISGLAYIKSTIESCVNKGIVESIKNDSAQSFMGGIVGFARSSIHLYKCNNDGDMSFSGSYVYSGGIAGETADTTIVESCVNKGYQKITSTYYSQVGGIAGILDGQSKVDFAYNDGEVFLEGGMYAYAGGICAFASEKSIITRSKNSGDIYASAHCDTCYAYSGGIAGYAKAEIENSYNTGFIEVSGNKEAYVGGMAGLISDGYVKASYSAAKSIAAHPQNSKTKVFKGTLFGKAESASKIDKVYYLEMKDDISSIGENYSSSETLISVFSEKEMKSDNFAWRLNVSNDADSNSEIWSRIEGYPVIADENHAPIYRVYFEIDEKYVDYTTNYKGELEIPNVLNFVDEKEFVAWVQENREVFTPGDKISKDMHLHAVFADDALNQFMVTFMTSDSQKVATYLTNENGKLDDVPENPTSSVMHEFVGWLNSEKAFIDTSKVFTQNDTVYATYDLKYVVTFMNDNEHVLEKISLKYGALPQYSGASPEKISSKKYDYIFAGWDKTPVEVTSDVVYTAIFDSTLRAYAVKFMVGDSVINVQKVYYDSAAVEPAIPELDGYRFKKWDKAFDSITAAITVNAVFVEIHCFRVIVDDDGKKDSYELIDESNLFTLPENSPKTGYVFMGWFNGKDKFLGNVGDVIRIKSDISIKAHYAPRYYNVSFVVKENGKDKRYSDNVAYGNMPEIPKVSSDTTAKYIYLFEGWNSEIVSVTEDVVYKAKYTVVEKVGVNEVVMPEFSVKALGRDLQVSAARIGSEFTLMDVQGHTISRGRIDAANFNISVPNAGTYLVRVDNQVSRVNVK